ncbi:MAG: DUF5131 family protein [Anaerolineales bacterium]|nr:DUF5131 family protein [Anaerolineales bacterium]
MAKSKIDWCDYVWNPVTGCEKIATGCIHCYAEKMAARLVAMNTPGYGVSVSTQSDINKTMPILCTTPAGKRIVSIEPMLEKVNLWIDHGQGVGDLVLDNLDWVIAGCESGANRRHVTINAFRDLRDQCKEPTTRYPNGVPFFLKQMEIGGKVIHMPLLDGKIWDEKPS